MTISSPRFPHARLSRRTLVRTGGCRFLPAFGARQALAQEATPAPGSTGYGGDFDVIVIGAGELTHGR